MIKKIFGLLSNALSKNLVLDYKMMAIKRSRHIPIPAITNYVRINNFELVVAEIKEKKLSGACAELGVYKGEFAKYINQAFPDKPLYLFDTFEGFDSKDVAVETKNNYSTGNQDFSNTSLNEVMGKMKYPEQCIIKKGWFPDSLEGLDESFCFVSLDADLYKPIYDGLEYFYPRLVKGGYIFVHDYNNDLYTGAKEAVRLFCEKYGVAYVPISDSWGTVVIGK